MRDAALVNYHIQCAEEQAFHFDVDGVVGSLVSPELLPTTIAVQDLRDSTLTVDFDSDGITLENHRTKIKDFETSSDWEDSYNDELHNLLAERIGAKEVIVFDHTVRIDQPDADRRPARNVHNDFSPSGAQQRLTDILEEERTREFRAGHYGFVNVWRPVEHTIKTSPLGFIRPMSMRAQDWMSIELIYPDRRGQILGVAANDDHEWFYWSRMTPDEVAVFNVYDNQDRPFLGHSALDMKDARNSRAPRKSVESRTIVRY